MIDTKSIEGLKQAMAPLYSIRHKNDEANVKIAWGEALVEYLQAGHNLFDLAWFNSPPADLQLALNNEKS